MQIYTLINILTLVAKLPVPKCQQLGKSDRMLAAFQKKPTQTAEIHSGYLSSDDDYITDINETIPNGNYDSVSSKSGYSITTEANDDFEFYQSNNSTSYETNLDSTKNFPSNDEFFVINNVNNMPIMTSMRVVNLSRNNSNTDLNKNFRITRSNSKR